MTGEIVTHAQSRTPQAPMQSSWCRASGIQDVILASTCSQLASYSSGRHDQIR